MAEMSPGFLAEPFAPGLLSAAQPAPPHSLDVCLLRAVLDPSSFMSVGVGKSIGNTCSCLGLGSNWCVL